MASLRVLTVARWYPSHDVGFRGVFVADLARALREVLEAPDADRAAMRERCLRVTRERFCWELAVEPYLAELERLGV